MSDKDKKPKELKKFPMFNTDEEAEQFVDTADLSEYDFSDFRPMTFEYVPKDKSISLRMPEALLEKVKARAEHIGMPYQRFIRHAIEQAVQDK